MVLLPSLSRNQWAFTLGTYISVLEHPVNHQWQHRLSDIVSAVASAGLSLHTMEEYPWGFYNRYPQMSRTGPSQWDLPEHLQGMPLSFDLLAVKPA